MNPDTCYTARKDDDAPRLFSGLVYPSIYVLPLGTANRLGTRGPKPQLVGYTYDGGNQRVYGPQSPPEQLAEEGDFRETPQSMKKEKYVHLKRYRDIAHSHLPRCALLLRGRKQGGYCA